MAVTKTAEQRVADLRTAAEQFGEDVSHLSDLELLNQHLEVRDAECINTRDRYMGLLVDQRKHEERVRAATVSAMKGRIDILAAGAVQSRANEMEAILAAVEVLPARPNAERVEALQKIAANTRHMLRLRREDPRDPANTWRLDNNRDLVHHVRTVIGVLGGRDGISADEVIRLVGEAVAPNGNLRDLFTVADAGTRKPELSPKVPTFLGRPGWSDRNSYYAYEPDGTGARVVAYDLGEEWHLDLYSPTGSLLAYGITSEQQVAPIAVALVEHAPAWAADRSRRPWQRYAELAERPALAA